jgi:hypothetical protein
MLEKECKFFLEVIGSEFMEIKGYKIEVFYVGRGWGLVLMMV